MFLHGLGDTPSGWSSIQSALPQTRPSLSCLAYRFPPAPVISITINGGSKMPGWFDLCDWPIAVGSKDDRKGLERSVAAIETEVKKLQDEEGIPPERIVVGGFSQGGAAALLAAYRGGGEGGAGDKFRPYAGCAVLSGWLTLPDELKVPEQARDKTPLLWAHGEYDDKVLFEQQAFGVDKLRGEGVKVTDLQYDMGHQSDPDELVELAKFLESTLFGSDKKGDEL